MIKTFKENYDVKVFHAWGMTEMSPLGTVGTMKPEYASLPEAKHSGHQTEAGLHAVRRRDEDHRRRRPCDALGRQDLRPHQGARLRSGQGLLQGRGPALSTTTDSSTPATSAPWTRYGYMQITDRSKDVIKSGGEWISSIDLENLAVGHPKVAEAAVIGVRASKMGRAAAAGHRAQGGPIGHQARRSSASSKARSPNGGCRTISSSLLRSRIPRPARFRRSHCASSLRTTCSRHRLPPNK